LRILFSAVGESLLMVLVYVSPAHPGVAKVSCSLVEFLVPVSDLVSTAACLKTVFCLPLVVSYAVSLVLDPPVSKAQVFLIFIVLIWRLLGHACKTFDEICVIQ
jgi:hypothetical protein